MSEPLTRGPAPEAYRHCEKLVRGGDRDRFLAALFTPAERRPALYALYAFDLEVRRIGERVRDPLAGEIRIQWWREAIQGERPAEVAAHPVAGALLAAIDEHAVPREPLLGLLEARGLAVYGEPFQTRADLNAFAQATEGGLLGIAWCIADGRGTPAPTEAAQSAVLALALTGLLLRLPAEAARGRCVLPLDLLAEHGVTAGEVTAGVSSPGLQAALAALRAGARRAADRLVGDLAGLRSPAAAVFLPALLVPLYLDRMARADFDPFKTAVEVPQWRRQWRMWRLARRLSR